MSVNFLYKAFASRCLRETNDIKFLMHGQWGSYTFDLPVIRYEILALFYFVYNSSSFRIFFCTAADTNNAVERGRICRYMVGYLRKSIEGIRISLKSRDSHTFCPLSAISGMCSVKEGYAS